MYEKGQGIPYDLGEAFKWYRLAADQGYGLAQRALGFFYETQEFGGSKDYISAYMWYSMASDQGDQVAAKGRGRVEKKMSDMQIEKAKKMALKQNLKINHPEQLKACTHEPLFQAKG